jgi:hypothetical protein
MLRHSGMAALGTGGLSHISIKTSADGILML